MERRKTIRRHKTHKLHRSQRVIYYLDDQDRRDPGLRRLPDYFSSLYPKMLLEDVGMFMVPVTGARVELVPSDQVAEQVVADAISLRDHGSDLSWAAHKFFNVCAQRIMAYGEAVYAIVYLSPAQDENPVDFDLVPIHPATVTRKKGTLAQYVPASQRQGPNAPEYIDLPPDQTAVFRAPDNLRPTISRTLAALASVGISNMPDWAMEELATSRRDIPFDGSAHRRAHGLAIAEACRDLGWDARSLNSEKANVLEYYWLHRRLRFERFKIELREHLLGTLNEVLARAGREVGFAGQLMVEGVPSLEDVEAAESNLVAGNTSFNDLMDPFTP